MHDRGEEGLVILAILIVLVLVLTFCILTARKREDPMLLCFFLLGLMMTTFLMGQQAMNRDDIERVCRSSD